jgi:hypothetical protein
MTMEKFKRVVIMFVLAAPLVCNVNAHTSAAAEQLTTIRGIVESIQKCWVSPSLEGGATISFSVRVGFRGNGDALGTPFVSFLTSSVSDEDRAQVRAAVEETFRRCTPLPFSKEFGASIAGRPIIMRFFTDRGRKIDI